MKKSVYHVLSWACYVLGPWVILLLTERIMKYKVDILDYSYHGYGMLINNGLLVAQGAVCVFGAFALCKIGGWVGLNGRVRIIQLICVSLPLLAYFAFLLVFAGPYAPEWDILNQMGTTLFWLCGLPRGNGVIIESVLLFTWAVFCRRKL